MSGEIPQITSETNLTNIWAEKSSAAARDLTLKKIGIVILALFNFGAIGVGLYYIVSYVPIPTQAFLISPFVVGVLGALAYLKFPTLGINKKNYGEYSNPAVLIGKGLAYLFFGPLMFAIKKIDWTPYHDPIRANAISDDLEKRPFDEVAQKYGSDLANLSKYGFIPGEYLEKIDSLYKRYVPVKEALKFWKSELGEESSKYKESADELKRIETEWEQVKAPFKTSFPKPTMPTFEAQSKISLFFRKYFLFNPELHKLKPLET